MFKVFASMVITETSHPDFCNDLFPYYSLILSTRNVSRNVLSGVYVAVYERWVVMSQGHRQVDTESRLFST